MNTHQSFYRFVLRMQNRLFKRFGFSNGLSKGVRYILMLLLANPLRIRRRKNKLLAEDVSLSQREKKLLEDINIKISPHDTMYSARVEHYFLVGLSALRLIQQALDITGKNQVTNILDMSCGFGRVLRFLSAVFPKAEITACDIETKGVDFCAKTFKAIPACSSKNFTSLSLNAKYDFIWCGSLVTHLNAGSIIDLLEFFNRHLAPEGILVFTFHGRFVADRLKRRTKTYKLKEEDIDDLVTSFHKNGFGYADYPYRTGYGISLTSPEWIRRKISRPGPLRELYFVERGWDNHQDTFAFLKPR